MANLFTPEPSTSIAFEQPVAPVQEPSLLQGLASTADSFLKATVSGSKGSGSGSKVDPNLLKEFSIQAQQVKSIEDSKGSAAGSLARKKMLTAWNAQGIDTSDDAFSTIWGSTGLGEWKKRAESSVEAQQNEFLKGATGQAFYIAELGRSAPGTPDSLVRQNALLAASKFELAAKTVATTKLMDNAQFAANGGAEHITSFLKETADISISGALDAVAKGAPVTEGAILQLKALIGEVYRQNMPANVTDEELLKPYTKEYERIVSQLDTIQASVSSGILKSGLTAEIVAKAKGAGLSASETMSFISLVSSDSALLKDSTTRDRLLKAFKATDAKVWQSKGMEDYTKAATKKANGNSPDLPGAPVSDAVKQRMEEIGKLDQPGAEALYDIRMKQLANSDVNTEEGAEAWQRAAMDMGIMLQSTGTGLLPEDVMSRVFNEKFFSNFDKLYAKDPYKASIVAGSVREGLQREAEHHERLLSSMEEKFPFVTVDESGGYRITPEMLEKHFGTKTSPVERATFMAATEGGNLEAVFAKGSWGKAQDDLPHFPGMANVLKLSAQRRNLRQAEKHVGTIVDIINKRHAGSLPVDETLGAEKPSLLQRFNSSGFATRNVKSSAAVVQDNPLYQPLIDMGVPASELQGVVTGESGGRTSVKNPNGSASGIFQITKDAAKDLGTTTEKIRAMSEVEQVDLYGKYLKRWGYKPGIPLAIMQAAPDKARGWDGTDEYVLYKKGSAGWKSNKDWRDKLNNDDVTVGSVKAYFKRNEGQTEVGKPFITAKVGAEVVEGGVLSGVIPSIREALGLGSDEEAQSVAEKLMKSGVIPTRPEGLSVDQPMRLPPVRGEEQNSLPPSNPTLAAAQLRQQSRDQANISLNSESLSQLDPGTAESLVRLGSPIAGLVIRQLPWANAQAFGQYISKGKIDIKDVPLNDNDKTLLREKAAEALASGKNKLDYSSWGVTGKGVLVGNLVNTASKTVSDANFRMATFLGQATVRKAANGDIIISDKYDFNPGPKGDKLKEALLAREMGDVTTYEKLKEEALGGASWFEATRIWAATLKVNDKPAEVFEINLGQ